MRRYRRWLLAEIELWHQKGMISSPQAREIASLYQHDEDPTWGKVIFAALGALVFALGIILLFAYNWEAMHRFSKLALIFTALGSAHALGFHYSSATSSHKKIGESLHLLGSMLFGAAIWLVAQIYHIDEHYPNALLIWALGALALAWLLPSLAQTLLCIFLLGLWHWFEVFDFHTVNHPAVWIIVLAVVPLAWLQRNPATLFISLIMLLITYASTYTQGLQHSEETVVTVLFSLSSCYIIFSHIAAQTNFPQSVNAIRWAGISVFSGLLFISTFPEFGKLYFHFDKEKISTTSWFYFLAPLVCAGSLSVLLFTRYRPKAKEVIDKVEISIVSLAFAISALSSFKSILNPGLVWIAYSALFLAYSLLLIYRGSQYLRWQSTALGSLLLSAYTFARFMDLFDSLLLRGFAFILIGALLFSIGLYYSRQKAKSRKAQKSPWQEGGTSNEP